MINSLNISVESDWIVSMYVTLLAIYHSQSLSDSVYDNRRLSSIHQLNHI